MAFGLFGKKPPPDKPGKKSDARKGGSGGARPPSQQSPTSEPEVSEDDAISLDFTDYTPPKTLLTGMPGMPGVGTSQSIKTQQPTGASQPVKTQQPTGASQPVKAPPPAAPKAPTLDFGGMAGMPSAPPHSQPDMAPVAPKPAAPAPQAKPSTPPPQAAAPAAPPVIPAPQAPKPVAAAAAAAPVAEAPAGPKSKPPLNFYEDTPKTQSGRSRKKQQTQLQVKAPLDSIMIMEVEKTGSNEVPTLIEESAVLFANGQSEEALGALNKAVQAGDLGSWNLPAWLMRFDLYQQLGRKSEFEEQALDFVVKFERSPPAWVDLPPLAAGVSRTASSAQISMSGVLSAASATVFDHLRRGAERQPKLHLDFAKLQGLDAQGAKLLLSCLKDLRGAKKEVYISGEQGMLRLLREQAVTGDKKVDEAVWQLLLDLYQQLGMQEEFEEAAVDYAVTYEVSPPSWEARSRVQPPASAQGGAALGHRDASDESFRIEGDIAGQQDPLFTEFAAYAKQANPIVVDLSGVRRIDFVNAGRLLKAIELAHAASRPVVLRAAGEMMMALFAVMGIHKLARIIPRK